MGATTAGRVVLRKARPFVWRAAPCVCLRGQTTATVASLFSSTKALRAARRDTKGDAHPLQGLFNGPMPSSLP